MLSSRPISRLPASLLLSAALSAVAGVCAASTITVSVTDKDGATVADAVVTLDSASGKQAVKPAAGVEMAQVKRQFVPRVLVVPVGTPVSFPNQDSVRHQVYSFSPANTFELKLYAGTPGEPVVFDKAGTAVLGCNIHDKMAAWIYVVETPYYGKTEVGGEIKLQQVPPGNYKLTVWHPAMPANTPPWQQALTVGKTDLDSPVKLAVSAASLP